MSDLYVSPFGSDTNDGTQDSPFKTILGASAAAKPGTTIHVAPGTYEGGFETTASGTASDPIRYVSDTKWGAKIVPAANSTMDVAWQNTGDYVTIDGFEIDGSNIQDGTPWMFGLFTKGSHSVITNNNVHDIARHDAAIRDGNGGSGIGGDGYNGDTDISVLNNVVHDIGPANGNNDLIHGIYLTTNGDIKNNLVYQVDSVGIHLWHDASNVNIVNNTVFANGSGILVGAGDFVNSRSPNDNTVVANNIVYDNRGSGISEQGLTGTNNTYHNNLVFQNGTDWRLQNGVKHTDTISADPQFVNYQPDGSGDYRLSASSPAIDAGTVDKAPEGDLDGTVRTQGSGSDIGAYEFTQSAQGPAQEPAPAPVEPEAEAPAPEAGAAQPETEASEPDAEPVEPETETEASKPELKPADPEVEASAPEPEASAPEAGPAEPETETSGPEPEPVEPEIEASPVDKWKDGSVGKWIRELVGHDASHVSAGDGHNDGDSIADRLSAALDGNFHTVRSFVDAAMDKAGSGIDTALVWVKNHSLSDHAENMVIRAPEGSDVTGNALDNPIQGGQAHDAIQGGEGLFAGGDGQDALAYGGSTGLGDSITGFAIGKDKIDLGDLLSNLQGSTVGFDKVDGKLAITLQQDDASHIVGVLDGINLDGVNLG